MTYGGDNIPKSPFSVAVAPTLDLSKINVSGLGDSAYFLSSCIISRSPFPVKAIPLDEHFTCLPKIPLLPQTQTRVIIVDSDNYLKFVTKTYDI